MTLHFKESLTLPTPETFLVKGLTNCDHRDTGIGGRPSQTCGRLQMGAPSRGAPFRPARTLASIQYLNGGAVEKKDAIPQLRYGHVHQHRDGLSSMLSAGHVWRRPFTLSYSGRYKPKLSSTTSLPSTLFLRGLSTFPVQNCKTSGANVTYAAYNLLTLKDNLNNCQNGGHFNTFSPLHSPIGPPCVGQSYPDPLMGASRSFLHRISELSSLEGETAKQEKLKKLRLSRKESSS
ncbi:uncharacterized protein si:ch211-171b20.3 isoform X2 [Corythoichthys intestinalis]|uniref:uncharacterized protein si:ch211-171b20.3 isoform X2 n=1 Tax=Corythoichthys intestinalis TaxID=161448 RepID=UPI0025A5491E|nr:uncharacterized protein si:ch211-171b20.3 isoform X2 [Corythoichthys intestinalis]